MEKKFYKYYQVESCYERENKETKENEVCLVVHEWKGKGILSSYPIWIIYSPEEFVKKYGSIIKNDEYNKWLSRKNLRCEVEFMRKNECIIDSLPDDMK